MKKDTAKQETYIAYLNGVIDGIKMMKELDRNDAPPSAEELLSTFVQKADKANERLERKAS